MHLIMSIIQVLYYNINSSNINMICTINSSKQILYYNLLMYY